MLDDGPRDGKPVERRGAAADFIEEHEARRCGVMQDGGDFAHFDEERRAAAREVIACTDARENAIGDRKLCLSRWNERAHLRHQHNQRGLAKICGLAAHVWTSDEQELLSPWVETKIVGHEALAALAQEFFDDRMASPNDEQLTSRIEFRPRITAIGSQLCKRSEHIQLRDGGSRAAQAHRLRRDERTKLDEKLALNLENALIGGEDLALVFFQLGTSKAFRVHKRLLTFVIGRRQMQIRLRNLQD